MKIDSSPFVSERSEVRLKKLLLQNKDKVKISNDGYVSVDFTSKEAQEIIREDLLKVERIIV